MTPERVPEDARDYGPLARSAFARYGVAVVLALTAVLVSRILSQSTEEPSYGLLVAAVAIAVWYGGFKAGLLAVVVGFSLSPLVHTGLGLEQHDDVRWAISLVAGVFVVWVSVVMRRGHERAATAAVAAEESSRHMETLQEFATALSAAASPTDVARVLVERAPTVVGAQGCGLGLVEGDDLVLVDLAGAAGQVGLPGVRVPLTSRTLLTRAVAGNQLQRAFDRETIVERYPDSAALLPEVEAALAVPLRVAGEVVGAIGFVFTEPELAHEEAESVGSIVADLGGQALQRARVYEGERQRRRALDRILRVVPQLHSGTPEEIRRAICREARNALGADFGAIWRVQADELALLSFDPENEIMSPGLEADLEDFPRLLDTVNRVEVTFVADILEEARGPGLERARRLGIRSSLRAPISVGGRAQLVLIVSWHTIITEPDSSTTVFVRRLADQAGLALEQLERRQAEEEARRRARETRRLLDATAALAAAATPSEVTGAILREGVRSLGATAGLVVSRQEKEDGLQIVDTQGYDPSELEPWETFPIDAPLPFAEAVRAGSSIAIESSAELETRYPELVGTRAGQAGAWLVVPLSAAGSVIGAVGFSFGEPRRFAETDLEFAEALARQSGQALDRALLLAAEYAARTRAEDMVVLTSALSQAVSPTDVLQAAGGQVLSLVGADAVGMYLFQNGSTLELIGTVGDTLGVDLEDLEHLPLDDATPPARAARDREAVWVRTEEDWARFPDAEPWRRAGVRSAGAVPLMVDRRLLGVLFVAFGTQTEIEADARRVIESVARHAAQPLERTWLMDREQAARIAAEAASRRTRQLQLVTQELAAAATPRDVATILVREALAAVSGDAAALFAFGGQREAPELLAESGMTEDDLAQQLVGPVTDAAMTGAPLVVEESAAGVRESTIRAAIAGAGHRSAVCVPLGVGTRILGSLLVCFGSRDRLPEEDTALLQTLARVAAQALERSRLFDNEQRLRLRTERIQGMTASLSGSLTQQDVADVVVEAVAYAMGADASAFSIVLEDRQLQKKLSWHGYGDELQEPWLEVPLDARTPGNRALRSRTMVFCETIDALGTDFPEAVRSMRDTGHESFLFVPLVAGGKTNGLVVMSWAERVALSGEDRMFIETLASQAAQALDRARHFESERTIAETLQRSVLPVSLPRVDGIQLAARYLPGTEEVDVGGDWFDAIQLRNGRLGLAVGDVVGKGVQSAATMAQLRNALRAFALDQMKPSTTVARLNRLTEEISDSAFATTVYAVLDPETGVCRFTSAGHPPPLVRYASGRAELLEEGRGLPLGAGPDTAYSQHTVELPVGSTFVLYTDGLIERRGEAIDVGLEQLRQAAEDGPGEPEKLVEFLLDRLVGRSERGDDIAMLAVRLLAVAPKPLHLDLPCDVRSLDLVRDALRVWLEHAPATQLEAHEIVLAAWEACANAVEHPHGPEDGSFHLTAELFDSAVRVLVRDSGRWLPETERSERGLGLRLIRSVMSSVDVEVTEEGTLIRLEKALAG